MSVMRETINSGWRRKKAKLSVALRQHLCQRSLCAFAKNQIKPSNHMTIDRFVPLRSFHRKALIQIPFSRQAGKEAPRPVLRETFETVATPELRCGKSCMAPHHCQGAAC